MIYCARSNRQCSSVPAGGTCGNSQGWSGSRSARPFSRRSSETDLPAPSPLRALAAGSWRFATTSTAIPTAPSTRSASRESCTSSMRSKRNRPRGLLPRSDTWTWCGSACARLRPSTKQPREPEHEQETFARLRDRQWQYLCRPRPSPCRGTPTESGAGGPAASLHQGAKAVADCRGEAARRQAARPVERPPRPLPRIFRGAADENADLVRPGRGDYYPAPPQNGRGRADYFQSSRGLAFVLPEPQERVAEIVWRHPRGPSVTVAPSAVGPSALRVYRRSRP